MTRRSVNNVFYCIEICLRAHCVLCVGSAEGDTATPEDDSNRKCLAKAPEDLNLPEVEEKGKREVPVKKEEKKMEREVKEKQEVREEVREEEEEEEVKESDGEEDSESDDPDRLWCICHKPHDDR